MEIKTVQSLETIPDFIERGTIMQMNDDQLDEMLHGVRERRMQAQLVYQQHMEAKEQARSAAVGEKIDKKAEMIVKTLETSQKALDRLEKYVQELRSLRIEGGMSVI